MILVINLHHRNDHVNGAKIDLRIFVCIMRAMAPHTDNTMSINQAHRERLAYIDFKAYFFGELTRMDLIERFGISPAVATRAIAQYMELAPGNLRLDNRKVYRPTSSFAPWHEHSVAHVLALLAEGLAYSSGQSRSKLVPCEQPAELSMPTLEILSAITRALHQRKAVRVRYVSITSGEKVREIVPVALVTNRVRWHVRAYDRQNNQFLDFVLRRMLLAEVLDDSKIAQHEQPSADAQWSRIINLELVPHPKHPREWVARLDYDMPDGVLRIAARAANVGYLLKLWAVDCSPDHSLDPAIFHLWLRDPFSIYGASTELAPGYVQPSLPSV